MRKRFHAEPRIQATELLLQERTPREVVMPLDSVPESGSLERSDEVMPVLPRMINTPHHATPRTRVLSNGRYAVMLTAAGSGYSHWGDTAITRWAGDVTCDDSGSYVFLRDVDQRKGLVRGYQPSGIEPDSYEVRFSEHRAKFMRRDGDLTTTLDVVVSAECDAEVRRVNLSNMGDRDTDHRTLIVCRSRAGAASCRRRTSGVLQALRGNRVRGVDWRHPGNAATALSARSGGVGRASRGGRGRMRWVRTIRNRSRPLRRSRATTALAARDRGRPRAGRHRRHRARSDLQPDALCATGAGVPAARVAFWTLVAPSRDEVLDLVDQHRDAPAFDRAATLAWTQGAGGTSPPGHHQRRRPCCSSVWPDTCSTTMPRCGRRPKCCGAATAGKPHSGHTEFPAICRSCWCASTMRTISASCDNYCAHSSTGD